MLMSNASEANIEYDGLGLFIYVGDATHLDVGFLVGHMLPGLAGPHQVEAVVLLILSGRVGGVLGVSLSSRLYI